MDLAKPMIFCGEEIRALIGAVMVYEYVPWVDTPRPILSEAERKWVEAASLKLDAAQLSIRPAIPRDTPGWLAQLHRAETAINFGPDELDVLSRIVGSCLLELRTDGDLSAQVGGVHLSALRSAHEKLLAARSSHSSS